MSRCDQIWQKANTGDAKLTVEEQQLLEFCNEHEVKPTIWHAVPEGCSWYCGGGPDSVTASSHLRAQGANTYGPGNAHDLGFKHAWVEGVDGYGIGEYLTYHFRAESPRITKIIVANGYVKSPGAWKKNSRVKKLKVYYNDQPLAILNLEDKIAEQTFEVPPIGHADRENFTGGKPWKLKFEILEVYKGDKYDDTVIAEIYFDGLDVH